MNNKKKKAAVKSIKKDISTALKDQLQEAMLQVVSGLGFDSKNTVKELKKASIKLASKITSKVKIIITKDEDFAEEGVIAEAPVAEEAAEVAPVVEKKVAAPRKRPVAKKTV